jgi:hypothetical protein
VATGPMMVVVANGLMMPLLGGFVGTEGICLVNRFGGAITVLGMG